MPYDRFDPLHAVLFSCIAVALAGCGANAPGDDASGASAIIGGTPDATSYPAVGYLVAKITSGPHAGEIVRPVCSATLIAPNAIATAAPCVEEQFTTGRTIVGVGFGTDLTGPTFDVAGTWKDWVDSKYFVEYPQPDGSTVLGDDARYAVAIVPLAAAVPGVAPMPIADGPIAPNTPAVAIGYGRVTESNESMSDDLAVIAADPTDYPGVRKSANLTIAVAVNMIDAYPTDPSGAGGGVCGTDYGAPLILAGGVLAGVFANYAQDDINGTVFDHKPLCRNDSGGSYANFQFSDVPGFVSQKLAALPH